MLTFQTFAAPCRVSPLVPPTTTCWAPRLPVASHNYLLPPTTTCCLPRLPPPFPRLPAASRDYLLPSHDYLLPPTERNGGTIAMLARKDDNTTGKVPREKDW